MGIPGVAIQAVDEGDSELAVRFVIEWVSDGEAEARTYLVDHAEPDGTSLIAMGAADVIGYVAIAWKSNYAGFRSRDIPLVHQIAVAGPVRRRGVATLLMDAAEQLARDRGIATPGIAVGLFDEYGPAQRLYGRRGYVLDGRGACQGQRPPKRGGACYRSRLPCPAADASRCWPPVRLGDVHVAGPRHIPDREILGE